MQYYKPLIKPKAQILLGNVNFLWLTESKYSYIVGQEGKKELEQKILLFSRVAGFGSGTFCFTKIVFNHACFPMSFRVADLLRNSKLLLLKDFTTGFIGVDKKIHLLVSSQRSYGLYPPGNACLELTLVRLELSLVRLCRSIVFVFESMI